MRRQTIPLSDQLPEGQAPVIIQYIYSLAAKTGLERSLERDTAVSPKMRAFMDLEQMVKPIPPLDYQKGLDEARDAKHGHPN